jgi:TolA-binding protein
MKRMMIIGILTLALAFNLTYTQAAEENSSEVNERLGKLEGRLGALEKQISELTQQVQDLVKKMSTVDVVKKMDTGDNREKFRQAARERAQKDNKVYTPEQLGEIETLYQVANNKWNTPEAKDSLEKLIQKYDKANRTGCAVLYLGQMSEGETKEKYLKMAIEKFSDCYYFDGVQVGAYARLHLANYYQQTGKKDEAAKLFKEIRDKYPDAIDHRGNPLSGQLPRAD